MDALKQVLYALRLKPQMFYRSTLAAPWGIRFSVANAAAFHVIERGSAWLRLADAPPLALETGDLIVISNTARYDFVDDLRSPAVTMRELLSLPNQHGILSFDPDCVEAATTLLCGEFRPEQSVVYPLFSLMPPLIYIPNRDGQAIDWLSMPLLSIASEAEARHPGHEIVISRLMDILFIMVVRFWIAHHAPNDGGWLRALYHPQLGEVLGVMHRQPDRAWTVESLADIAHLSRSTFSAQFTATVGEPPMKYLTRWRLQLATNYLTDDETRTVEQVAQQVGYESAYAFSKAFKRIVGLSPTAYRRNASKQLPRISAAESHSAAVEVG